MYNRPVIALLLAAALSTSTASRPVDQDRSPLSTLDQVRSRLEAIDLQLKTLSAAFRQSITLFESGSSQDVEGSLRYRKPDRLHVEHRKPERQTIVSDGKSIWIHRRKNNQVIEASLAAWRKADPTLNSLLDFGSYAAWLEKYDVVFSSAARELRLKPKDRPSEFTLRLALNEWGFPAETELTVAQMRIKTILDDVKLNPEIPDSAFSFTPPAGAEVFRDFKPPQPNP